MMPKLLFVLALTMAPGPCTAAPKRAPHEKEALALFRSQLRASGRLHQLWLEAVASAPVAGQAANHVYEGLVRAEWAGLSDLERVAYLAQAQQEAEAKERALLLEAEAKGRARLLEAFSQGTGGILSSSSGPAGADAGADLVPPTGAPAQVAPEVETVPGLPVFPNGSAMALGREPAEPPEAPVPPPVFGAFLNTDAMPSSSSSSSSASSAAPGSPLTPVPPASPGAPHCSGNAAGSEGPRSSSLAAAARTFPSHPGAFNSAYSPALLAAVGFLPAEALAGWLAHASLGPPFAGLVQGLAGASAVPSSDLVFALQSRATAAPGHAAPAALAAAALFGRLGRPVGLAEVVHTLLLGANHLDPVVAEALVAVYGGPAQGAAAALRAAELRWAAGAAGGSSGGAAWACPGGSAASGFRGPGPMQPAAVPAAGAAGYSPGGAAAASSGGSAASGSGGPGPMQPAAVPAASAPSAPPPWRTSGAALPTVLPVLGGQHPPAPNGASRRSRRAPAAGGGGQSTQRRILPRADGRALTDVEILRLAATFPLGQPLYRHSGQAFFLYGSHGQKIGVAIRPAEGGGCVSCWLRQGKVTLSGPMQAALLDAIRDWTAPWAGGHAPGAAPPDPAALAAQPPPALAPAAGGPAAGAGPGGAAAPGGPAGPGGPAAPGGAGGPGGPAAPGGPAGGGPGEAVVRARRERRRSRSRARRP